ncbi:hypothetical protein [Haladaptatus salinisoli]|uniref:hypothetical protein n=1 Tax=Haladaptatus salinisoli TaxID=2884876 RepID=UPI001D0A2F19|nr:hypothetical protein [Haladaptatus salinisoli]
MSDENASDRYRTGADETDVDAVENRADQHVPEEDARLLARVPEWVVALGAGALLTATLITLAGSAFLWYSVSQGRFYGYQPYEIVLAGVQFTAVTAFQAVGVRWARRRIRWMWVMLAAIAGSLTFVALPFTAVALACIGLGKYHFTLDTPANVVRGEEN